MGDDDKDSAYSRVKEMMFRLSNLDTMEKHRDNPALSKDVFAALLEHEQAKERKEKEDKRIILSDFRKMLSEEDLDEAEVLLCGNGFLKKEFKEDISLAKMGKWKSVNYLIDNGFKVNEEKDMDHNKLFVLAVNSNQFEVVAKLKNQTHDLSATNKFQRSVRKEIMEYGKKETLDVLRKDYNFNFVEEFKKEFSTFNKKSFKNLKDYLTDSELQVICKEVKERVDKYVDESVTELDIIDDVNTAIVLAHEDLKQRLIMKLL